VTRRLPPIAVGEWHFGLEALFAQDKVTRAPGALDLLVGRSQGHTHGRRCCWPSRRTLALVAAGSWTPDAGLTERHARGQYVFTGALLAYNITRLY
jgi:hypothetical protein